MPRISVEGPVGAPLCYAFAQDSLTIGRSSQMSLVLNDPSLSRLHAEVRREGDVWFVEDRGSRNGTHLNGRKLERPGRLQPGDRMQLGAFTVVFEPLEGHGSVGPESSETCEFGLSSRGAGEAPRPALVGTSAAIRQVLATIDKVAPSMVSVLITGETGTGKEVVARLLHLRSPRRGGPFGVVACPALPGTLIEAELFGIAKGVATGVDARPGRFETARGGTLLLDEIGDMEIGAQSKILRVLQERVVERIGGREPIPLDVRVLAATHQDLAGKIEQGTFRRDLYHRLNTVTIEVPPLRARPEDIPVLVDHFLAHSEKRQPLSDEAFELLLRYPFPGNVRELEHLLEGASLLAEGKQIEASDLPRHVREGAAPLAQPDGSPLTADLLYDRVVVQGQSFWDTVQRPFLRRQVSAADVRLLVEKAYEQSGRSWMGVARLFHIESEYKKLFNFLRNHGLKGER